MRKTGHNIVCKNCGKEFYAPGWILKLGYGKFCSHKCHSLSMVGQVGWSKGLKLGPNPEHSKRMMGRIAWNKGKKTPKEIRDKMSIIHLGKHIAEKNGMWKGGTYKHSEGYIFIYSPNHPLANGKYVFQHRLVAEKYLGRYLKPEERIHHINGIKDDNRPENLYRFDLEKFHHKFHRNPYQLQSNII